MSNTNEVILDQLEWEKIEEAKRTNLQMSSLDYYKRIAFFKYHQCEMYKLEFMNLRAEILTLKSEIEKYIPNVKNLNFSGCLK